MRIICSLIISLGLISTCLAESTKVYESIDAQGNPSFSDTPTPGTPNKVKEVNVEPIPANEQAQADKRYERLMKQSDQISQQLNEEEMERAKLKAEQEVSEPPTPTPDQLRNEQIDYDYGHFDNYYDDGDGIYHNNLEFYDPYYYYPRHHMRHVDREIRHLNHENHPNLGNQPIDKRNLRVNPAHTGGRNLAN